MSGYRITDREVLLRKRQLRAEIARSRHATRATLAALSGERRRLTSWRTYVRRFPVATLGTAFGVGMWLAAARPGGKLRRNLASTAFRWGFSAVQSGVLNDLTSLWTAYQSRGAGPDADRDT
jgi:hypothetical protein